MARSLARASAQYLRRASAFSNPAAPLTLACWAYPLDDTTNHTLIYIGDEDTLNPDAFYMGMNGTVAGDPVRANVAVSNVFSSASTTSGFTANAWNHCCAVFTSSTSRTAYLNGGNAGTNTDSRTPVNANHLQFGRFVGTVTTYLDGRIALAAIWNVALTAAEVAALYNNGIGLDPRSVRPENLLGFWPLVNGDGDIDCWGQRDMTANGSPTYASDPKFVLRGGVYQPQSLYVPPAGGIVGPLIGGGRLINDGGTLIGPGRLVRV